MHIISVEAYKNKTSKSQAQEHILVPCWMYKIPVAISQQSSLNFLERTIAKIISIDSTLKDDYDKISKLIGFSSDDKTNDKTELVKFILSKLDNILSDDDKKPNIEIFQFYQDAYSSKLLPVITKNYNEFSMPDKTYRLHKDKFGIECTGVEFSQKLNKRAIRAYLFDKYNKNAPNEILSKKDFIKAILRHNKQKIYNNNEHTKHISYIDYSSFEISNLEPELVFLHVKLIFLQENHFLITNGWTNDYSTDLIELFGDKFYYEISALRQKKITIDTDKNTNNKNIDLPFDGKIADYEKIYQLLCNIEEHIQIINRNDISSQEMDSCSSKIFEYLFDALENSLKYIAQNDIDTSSIKEVHTVQEIARSMGFKLDSKKISILKASGRENFQKYLCRTIIFKKDEIKELASKIPSFIILSNKLLEYRDHSKHGSQKKINFPLPSKTMEIKELVYLALSIILKVKQKKVNLSEQEYDNAYYENAFIFVEKDFYPHKISNLPSQLQATLIDLWAIKESEFDLNIVAQSINYVYKIFEILIQNILEYELQDNDNPSPQEIKEQVLTKYKISDVLNTVNPNSLIQAFKNKGTLGAYVLILLYYKNDFKDDDIRLLEKIIELRGHGNQELSTFQAITKEDFELFIDNTKILMKKLISTN